MVDFSFHWRLLKHAFTGACRNSLVAYSILQMCRSNLEGGGSNNLRCKWLCLKFSVRVSLCFLVGCMGIVEGY